MDAITGLLVSRDSKLSEWGRSLNEDTRLIHTEKRLSRWMRSDRIKDDQLYRHYLELMGPKISAHHVIAVDGTDITKPAAQKMAFLGRVRDGSRSERNNPKTALGWEVVSIEAIGPHGKRAPLAQEIYSASEPGYRSGNAKTTETIATVRPHVSKNCIWLFDRGYDARNIYEELFRMDLRFVVRLVGNRSLLSKNEMVKTSVLSKRLRANGKFTIENYARSFHLTVAWCPVRLPQLTKGLRVAKDTRGNPIPTGPQLWLVRFRGRKKGSVNLLTSIPVTSIDDAVLVATAYIRRWGVEESIRYWKQGFNSEDLRVMSWTAIKRMMLLIMLAVGFMALEMHTRRTFVVRLIRTFARSFGEVHAYLYYRFQDALRVLITCARAPP